MTKELIKEVLDANLALVEHNLVILTWGNASAIDRNSGLVVIKPSGIDYSAMQAKHMVVVDLDGQVVRGNLKPSSDTATHLALYKAFPTIGGIVHTHSEWATSWAQAGKAIPPYGTTHADSFHGEIPCTRQLKKKEVDQDYEMNTGLVIAERFANLNPNAVPGVIVHGHGPFAWGSGAMDAVHNAVVMEQVAKMAFRTQVLGHSEPIDKFLLDKHYLRKHGKDAYYGQ